MTAAGALARDAPSASPAPRSVAVRAARAGGNNRLFRVETDAGDFALKTYSGRRATPRDRLGTEFSALRLLHRHGVSQRAAADRRRSGRRLCAATSGSRASRPMRQPGDHRRARSRSSGRSSASRGAADAGALPLASEACLSAGDHRGAGRRPARGVARRRLPSTPSSTAFLRGRFHPGLERRPRRRDARAAAVCLRCADRSRAEAPARPVRFRLPQRPGAGDGGRRLPRFRVFRLGRSGEGDRATSSCIPECDLTAEQRTTFCPRRHATSSRPIRGFADRLRGLPPALCAALDHDPAERVPARALAAARAGRATAGSER